MFRGWKKRFSPRAEASSATDKSENVASGSGFDSSFRPTSARAATASASKRTAPRMRKNRALWKESVAELMAPVENLQTFDAALQTADSRMADPQIDPTGLLVSPKGELLVIPKQSQQARFGIIEELEEDHTVEDQQEEKSIKGSEKDPSADVSVDCDGEAAPGDSVTLTNAALVDNPFSSNVKSLIDVALDEERDESEDAAGSKSCDSHHFQSLLEQHASEYRASMFVGDDFGEERNGFSARGWSIPATTLALEQTQQSLGNLSDFQQKVCQAKAVEASSLVQASQKFQAFNPSMGGQAPRPDDWEVVGQNVDAESRVGPLLQGGSSLNAALVSVEMYQRNVALRDKELFETKDEKLEEASRQFGETISARQMVLSTWQKRAQTMEQRLTALKKQRDSCWNAVYAAEEDVSSRLENMLAEKSRRYEEKRLEQIRTQKEKQHRSTASQEDIWNMVNAATESMEQGGFEPVSISPRAQPKDLLSDAESATPSLLDTDTDAASETSSTGKENINKSKMASASRDQLEIEVGLPNLRRAALDADNAVQDTAGDLLTILSHVDTARRSARLAAETTLLLAGQAQIDAVQRLVRLERESLNHRLEQLEHLEQVVSSVTPRDVRHDLSNYITQDKCVTGGASHLREDDDGGIAAALAVLSSHVDWHSNGKEETSNTSVITDDEESSQDGGVRELILSAVDQLFDNHEDSSSMDLTEAVKLLQKMATDQSSAARSRRSTILYSLNSKRSTSPKVPSVEQFDGLSMVCQSLLTGCCAPHSDDYVASAKMCIMLSQTFYIEGESTDSRNDRVYIKSKLKDHEIWKKDDFWDEMLGQQITESLTHSGVMSNFQKKVSPPKYRKSEWAQTFRTRWHDLNEVERIEAASQVQAVVFAQLSALAHSMLEFGCGLDRSCAFVRRMAIRNQLPSSQRKMLLQHLKARNNQDSEE